jgi:hypothetical protein
MIIHYSIHTGNRVFCAAIKNRGVGMYMQRKKDRRGFAGKTSFPLKTKGGCLVENDRRSIPDRRWGNIHLELVYLGDHNSPEYFTNSSLCTSDE